LFSVEKKDEGRYNYVNILKKTKPQRTPPPPPPQEKKNLRGREFLCMSSMDITSNNGLKLQWGRKFRLRFIMKKHIPVVKDSEVLE